MSYTIRLLNCNGNGIELISGLSRQLNINIKQAKSLYDNMPCDIAEYNTKQEAENLVNALYVCGAVTEIVSDVPEYSPAPVAVNSNCSYESVESTAEVREMLYQAYCGYVIKENAEESAKELSANIQKNLAKISREVSNAKSVIRVHKKVLETDGMSRYPNRDLFPKHKLELLDFSIIKGVFIAVTVLALVIFLIITAVSSDTLESMAISLNVNPGALVWFGSPIIGAVATLIVIIINFILQLKTVKEYNDRYKKALREFNPENEVLKAKRFMENIDAYNAEIEAKEAIIREYVGKADEAKAHAASLTPKLPFRISDELKSSRGISILLQYIDSGKADNIKEALALYDRDLKDAFAMQEMQKQTEYYRVAALNSEQILIETQRIAEANERAVEASERAAAAAETSAIFNAIGAYSAAEAADAAKRVANATEEQAYYLKKNT